MPNARPRVGETADEARLRYNAEARAYRALRKANGKPLNDVRTKAQITATGWWKNYRLRPEQVYALWEHHNRACAVCTRALLAPGTSTLTHIDHCHTSGRIRGILCSSCNLMLGHAKDNPETLARAAAYLLP